MRRHNPTDTLRGAAFVLAAVTAVSCTRFDTTVQSDYIGRMTARQAAESPLAAATRPATGPVEPRPASRPAEPLAVRLQDAILISLENNRSLAVNRLDPKIRRTFEQQERAVFDPQLSGELSTARSRAEDPTRQPSMVKEHTAALSAEKYMPTGTTVGVDLSSDVLDSSLYSDEFVSTRAGLTVTQALLRGSEVRANLANLHQARLDTLASQYELRGFAEALLAEVETAYWDYALAQRQIEIYTDSLGLAQKQAEEVRERIKIGKLAETELAAAQAEVALRREGLIDAQSALAKRRLQLLRLLNPSGREMWATPVVLLDKPAAPQAKLDDVEQHVQVALRLRPDLNQARLAVKRNELEVVKTRNGLLPRLDLFVALGKTGYASSFGPSVGNIGGDSYDALVGVKFDYPPLNRDALARNQRATLSRAQAVLAVDNLSQLVEQDVREAFIEVLRAREQIAATRATKELRVEAYRAESEKLRVGKSTSLLVAQTERDLLASEIAEVDALVTYLKAFVDLHRLEGSLLERRGILAPGRSPAETPKAP